MGPLSSVTLRREHMPECEQKTDHVPATVLRQRLALNSIPSAPPLPGFGVPSHANLGSAHNGPGFDRKPPHERPEGTQYPLWAKIKCNSCGKKTKLRDGHGLTQEMLDRKLRDIINGR